MCLFLFKHMIVYELCSGCTRRMEEAAGEGRGGERRGGLFYRGTGAACLTNRASCLAGAL